MPYYSNDLLYRWSYPCHLWTFYKSIPVQQYFVPNPFTLAPKYVILISRSCRLIVFALQQNGRMRNMSNILPHHKKLVIESRPPQQLIKTTSKRQQKLAKSRSSEFNIHRLVSKGKADTIHPAPRLLHRQSQSLQNYHKLKLQLEAEKPKTKSRFSLQYNLFQSFKNGIENTQNPVAANFEYLVQKTLTLMEEHSDLAPTPEERLVVSRVRLKEVMVEILMQFVQNHMKFRPAHCKCRELDALIGKLMDEAERELRSRATDRLGMASGVISCLWGAEELKYQQDKASDKLDHLFCQCSNLEQRISELTTYHSSLQDECKRINQYLQEQKRESQAIDLRISQANKIISTLTNTIQEAETRMAAISTMQSKIRNFAEEQHMHRFLRIVSQDYRRIQSDIYEYAVYLQSSQLANDLLLQPRPFAEIQGQIDEQEKELIAALGQKKESRKEQIQRVRTFLEDTIELFQRKDYQMMRLLQFRTKCIRQFVEHMKKWLSNWNIRQEFLGSLRKDFAIDVALLLSMTQKAVARGDTGADDMKQAAQRLIENYKMGNCFY